MFFFDSSQNPENKHSIVSVPQCTFPTIILLYYKRVKLGEGRGVNNIWFHVMIEFSGLVFDAHNAY